MNLLMNARDAVNKHHPGHNADKHIRISAVRHALNDQPAVLISVEDNGAGLDGLANDQLFDPFFTTKPRHSGSGLGLSICREIIQGHHGKVWFERIPEGGTVFHIALPLQQHSDKVISCHEQNTDS